MLRWIGGAGPGAIAFACVSLLACGTSLALTWRDWRNGWKISIRNQMSWLAILFGFGIGFAIGARNPYAYSGKPQIARTGVLVQKYRSIYYHHHWVGYGVLACLDSCAGDVPLLELNERESSAWEKAGADRRYSVVYLAQKEPVQISGGYAVTSHLVLALNEDAGGPSIYSLDIEQHWPQIVLNGSSAALCLITLIVCQLIAAMNPDPEDQRSRSDSDDNLPSGEEVTSLGLESQKRD